MTMTGAVISRTTKASSFQGSFNIFVWQSEAPFNSLPDDVIVSSILESEDEPFSNDLMRHSL